MDWLLDNSLATMQGPEFLVFYLLTSCFVLIGAYRFIAAQDTTGAQPPATPSDIDPYELAYLRGGPNEVVRTAVYALRQKGLIEVEKGRLRTSGFTPQALTTVERRVYETISSTQKIAALFSRAMREAIDRLCGAYRQRLSAQQLLASEEIRTTAQVTLGAAGGLLIGLAAYKIWAARVHGHSNLGFLFGEAVVAFIALFWIYHKTAAGFASRRGKAFLAQAQLAYSGRRASAVFGTSTDAAGRAAAGGTALLMVGLFGFDILKGTPDAALAKTFAQSSSSGGGCGGSGGGCGGGGGGCGGCGGS
jgi:uncharacterized protein (TIGR04222 family)